MPFGNFHFQFWNNPNITFADLAVTLHAVIRFTSNGVN